MFSCSRRFEGVLNKILSFVVGRVDELPIFFLMLLL